MIRDGCQFSRIERASPVHQEYLVARLQPKHSRSMAGLVFGQAALHRRVIKEAFFLHLLLPNMFIAEENGEEHCDCQSVSGKDPPACTPVA